MALVRLYGRAQSLISDEAALYLVGTEYLFVVLGVLKMTQRVVFVKQIVGRGCGLNIDHQGPPQLKKPGDVISQLGFAGTRFAGEQQRLPQRKGHIDRIGEL